MSIAALSRNAVLCKCENIAMQLDGQTNAHKPISRPMMQRIVLIGALVLIIGTGGFVIYWQLKPSANGPGGGGISSCSGSGCTIGASPETNLQGIFGLACPPTSSATYSCKGFDTNPGINTKQLVYTSVVNDSINYIDDTFLSCRDAFESERFGLPPWTTIPPGALDAPYDNDNGFTHCHISNFQQDAKGNYNFDETISAKISPDQFSTVYNTSTTQDSATEQNNLGGTITVQASPYLELTNSTHLWDMPPPWTSKTKQWDYTAITGTYNGDFSRHLDKQDDLSSQLFNYTDLTVDKTKSSWKQTLTGDVDASIGLSWSAPDAKALRTDGNAFQMNLTKLAFCPTKCTLTYKEIQNVVADKISPTDADFYVGKITSYAEHSETYSGTGVADPNNYTVNWNTDLTVQKHDVRKWTHNLGCAVDPTKPQYCNIGMTLRPDYCNISTNSNGGPPPPIGGGNPPILTQKGCGFLAWTWTGDQTSDATIKPFQDNYQDVTTNVTKSIHYTDQVTGGCWTGSYVKCTHKQDRTEQATKQQKRTVRGKSDTLVVTGNGVTVNDETVADPAANPQECRTTEKGNYNYNGPFSNYSDPAPMKVASFDWQPHLTVPPSGRCHYKGGTGYSLLQFIWNPTNGSLVHNLYGSYLGDMKVPGLFFASSGDNLTTIVRSPNFKAVPKTIVLWTSWDRNNSAEDADFESEYTTIKQTLDDLVSKGTQVIEYDTASKSKMLAALPSVPNGAWLINLGHGSVVGLAAGADTVPYWQITKYLDEHNVRLDLFAATSCFASRLTIADHVLAGVGVGYESPFMHSFGLVTSALVGNGDAQLHVTTTNLAQYWENRLGLTQTCKIGPGWK